MIELENALIYRVIADMVCDNPNERWHQLRLVEHDKDGVPIFMERAPSFPQGQTPEALQKRVESMAEAFKHPAIPIEHFRQDDTLARIEAYQKGRRRGE